MNKDDIKLESIEKVKIKLLLNTSDHEKYNDNVVQHEENELYLTRDNIYLPGNDTTENDTASSYPYIYTKDTYPYSLLREKTPQELIDIFFDKSKQYEFVKRNKSSFGENNEELELLDSNVEKNIYMMFHLLLPAKYPISNHVNHAVNQLIYQNEYDDIHSLDRYSYFQYEGKVHTVMKTILMNNIIQHPYYSELTHSVYKYADWARNKKATLEERIEKNAKKLKEARDKYVLLKLEKDMDKLDSNSSDLYDSLQKLKKEDTNPKKSSKISEISDLYELISKIKTDREKDTSVELSKNYDKFIKVFDEMNKMKEDIDYLGKYLDCTTENFDTCLQLNISEEANDEEMKTAQEILKSYIAKKSSNKALQEQIEVFTKTKKQEKPSDYSLVELSIFVENMKKEDKADKEENEEEEEEEEEIESIKSKNDKISFYDLKSGFQYVSEDEIKLEVVVHLDILEGEVNDENKKGVKCKVKDEVVTNIFEKIIAKNKSPVWKTEHMPFMKVEIKENEQKGGKKRRSVKVHKKTKKRKTRNKM